MTRSFPGGSARSAVLAAGLVLALATTLLAASPSADAAAGSARFERWSTTAQLQKGARDGVAVTNGAVVLSSPRGTLRYDDPWGGGGTKTWTRGTWTSPWAKTGFSAKRLVPSWNVAKRDDTWVRVSVRVRSGRTTGSWDTVAIYGFTSATVRKASAPTQSDDLASLDTDTIRANRSTGFDSWQVKIDLLRAKGSSSSPVVTSIGAVASSYATRSIPTSATSMTATKVLDVPRYSQMVHEGHHPEWDNGGEAWCSPTSTAMVLKYFKTGPKASDYAWEKGVDGQVDHAARYTYDRRYEGTGNWPFNTAYASRYGLNAFVTRLYSLREAEQFIKAGIPLVASIAFNRGGLDGSPLTSTPGHLLVIVGFTRTGQVVVNDPAGSRNSTVRRTYSRAQFEKAWQGGSGGVVYVIHPASKKLPTPSPRWS